MKKFVLSGAAVFIGISTLGCHTDDTVDELMDPLSTSESCSEGFKHSSDLQTLELKNASTKAISIINMTGIFDGAPKLGAEPGKFISIAAGGSQKFNFFVDSFANGGSMVFQANVSGKRLITLDPHCVESFQDPVYVRQSEGDDTWISLVVGEAPQQVLHIGLDDAWATDKAPAKSHTITIDDATFTKKGGQDSMDEAFRLKP
jgi:hypothetical protein